MNDSDLQAVFDRLAAQEAALTKQQAAIARQQKDLEVQSAEIAGLREQLRL